MNTDTNLTTDRPDPYMTERGHSLWPSETTIQAIPALYATDGAGPMGDRIVHLHYFLGGCDWWVIELNADEGLAFGYVRLHGDDQSAEWGSMDIGELASIYEPGVVARAEWGFRVRPALIVERDLHWSLCPAREVLPEGAWS